MATFTLTLPNRQTVYRLDQLISSQYPGEDMPVPTQWWTHISVQSDPDNTADIKFGDKELSGLRYGKVIKPGDERVWEGGGKGYTECTNDKYFLCEAADGQRLCVELNG